MLNRVFTIVFIYFCTVAAWIALGVIVTDRTQEYDTKLRGAVWELWGAKQRQEAPAISGCCGKTLGDCVPLKASDLAVSIDLDHRQKGLLWYSTYRVKFLGRYQITNPTPAPQTMTFEFKFPSEKGMYDDVRFLIGEHEIRDLPLHKGKLTRVLSLAPGQSETVEVRYVTFGMDEWWYDLGNKVNQVKNFSLTMLTNFNQIDFPDNSISPTKKEKTPQGWKLQWAYTNLLTGVKLGMVMPQKLNPGPWVSQVTYAAPISLFFFFFILFIISTLRGIRIHPMNYFFIGASFFSFHLLLAYLVGHISVHAAFTIAAMVSIVLVISYMRLVVGARLAFLEIGIAQLVYLVLFSYSFFFPGYTGLAITILSIATLFILMQMTGRLDWEALFGKEAPPVQLEGLGEQEETTSSGNTN